MNKKLRILMTVDPEIPVPPPYYGGIERIVYMLVCALKERGHDLHLFAGQGSKVPVSFIPYEGKSSKSYMDTIKNALQIRKYVNQLRHVDIVHSFGRLAYLLPLMKLRFPKIQSYQRYITPRSVRWGNRLAGKSLTFVACSRSCARTANFEEGHWKVIFNGIPVSTFEYNPNVPSDAPLIFLGRVERLKGAHTAIEVAKRTGRNLIVAGNHSSTGEEYEYFNKEVLSHCDGKTIRYVGEVNDIQKNMLLRNASALLFPIEWEEPFGIVMIEALACGTPVIALARGAVPEVIEDRLTGFICHSLEDMVEAVKNIHTIDRSRCRKALEQRFSDEIITDNYERLYWSCIEGLNGKV